MHLGRRGHEEEVEDWRRYYGPWSAWNHVRTLAGLAATAAMIAALTS